MRSTLVLLATLIFLAPFSLSAQQGEKEGELDPKFAAFDKDVAFVCGQFLPNQVPGITEMMPLCGFRGGLRVASRTVLEPQIVSGAAQAQKYLLGTFNFRTDFSQADLVVSMYGGPSIHYVTSPTYSGTTVAGDSTTMYFGVDFGSALWWEFNENFYLRTDLQFFLNPGTALFVSIGLTFRFGAAGGGGGQ